uniref:C2H2-type domain-containing protein n=1 Tax=Bubo bubo TaxID=30461 RepID=A0A8C0G2V2_BUBBB
MGGRWRRTVSRGREPTAEQGRSVRSPPPEEEGAAETTGDGLTPTPIPAPCSPQLSPFVLPTGAGTDKQKEEQCQPREEQRGMLKKYKCEHCGKNFACETSLRRHQRTYTGENPFKCQDCGKSFSRSWHLLRHQMTHAKEKPFLCTTCGKRFSNNSSLIRHRQTHTGESLYPCLHCGKNFQQSFHLREHQERTHTKEKPFVYTTRSTLSTPHVGNASPLPQT